MTNREKTIQHLDNDLNTANVALCNPQTLTPEMCVRIGQAVTSAIDLLKEQEPVKPNKWVPKRQTFTTVREWYCSNCNFNISYGDRYCRNCGRKVKWDEGAGH